MIALSADIALGGADKTVFAALHEDAWFANLTVFPGVETKDGRKLAGLLAAERRDGADVSVDLTGGWGAAVLEALKHDLALASTGLVASARSSGRTADGRLGFANCRAEWWWRFREALDPQAGDSIKLPPDPRLAAELAAPTWRLKGTDILVEEKAAIRKRIGGSTDRADAVVQAWSRREAVLLAQRCRPPPGGWTRVEDDEYSLEW